MELLEEIVARDARDANENADTQQPFHALAFPARHGARVIQRLTAACGSLVDLGFPHLKRMKKHDATPGSLLALLVPVATEGERAQLSGELTEQLQREFDGSLCIVDVLKRPPQTREAWAQHTKQWPLIFHASVVAETQVEPITEREATQMVALVRQAMASGQRFRQERPTEIDRFCCAAGCVIADPSRGANGTDYAVVADSLERLQAAGGAYAFRTLFHPVMVAIDGVAARDRARESGPSRKHRRVDAAAPTTTDPSTTLETARTNAEDDTSTTESYLCTGYDVFVDVEPCTLCAMALVHSRARRVVFAHRNATDGALASVHRLHTIKSLNHHYRVFHLPVNEETKPTE